MDFSTDIFKDLPAVNMYFSAEVPTLTTYTNIAAHKKANKQFHQLLVK